MSRCLRAAMRFTVAIAVLVTAFPAAAAPVLRYNWDRCEPLVRNQDYEGPGLYRQTLSITDLPAGTTHLYFYVEVLVDSWYRAWEFFREDAPARNGSQWSRARRIATPFPGSRS